MAPTTLTPGVWQPDVLGSDFSSTVLSLGRDPDGEGVIEAVLIRHETVGAPALGAVLYVHGFTDYFFQRELAEFFAAHGYQFYAVDLRKCGRARRKWQTAHYITDLRYYDDELNTAIDAVYAETTSPIVVVAHSTGGLITPLWLDRIRRTDPARHRRVSGLILNSPWFDLQGPAFLRTTAMTAVIDLMARVDGKRVIPRRRDTRYGESLHSSEHGEWDYDLAMKPLAGVDVTFGFIAAIRTGQAALHRGLDVGVPSLVLRSHRSSNQTDMIDEADAVLDVRQITRWAGCLGNRISVVPIAGARHDVFLSTRPVRDRAYDEVARWLVNHTASIHHVAPHTAMRQGSTDDNPEDTFS